MNIAVIGAGRMGTWFALGLKDEHTVGVYDRLRSRSWKIPGVVAFRKLEEIRGFVPDLLINAVSIQHTVEAFQSVLPLLASSCIICDVMSVKGKISEFYREIPLPFVSLHPMFGPTFADAEQLDKENLIIIRESCEEGKSFFRGFFSGLGVNVFEYSFDRHDELIAYSLTLPFASSLVFAANMDASTVPGTTFKKHHEIARGLLSEDDTLLAEILFNPHSLTQLDQVTHKLEFLKHVIRGRDLEEAKRFFAKLRENI
jgi:prephenate dehydrogenase